MISKIAALEKAVNLVQHLLLFELFLKRFQGLPAHYSQLFEILEKIIEKDPSLSSITCLETVLYVLSNMEASFVERREGPFFQFLISCFSRSKELSNQNSLCTVSHFSHEVTFPFRKKQVMGLVIELQGCHGELDFLLCQNIAIRLS